MLIPLLMNNLLSGVVVVIPPDVIETTTVARAAIATTSLRLYYTAIPPPMVDARDEPDFPREFHQGLVDLALADLLGQERETDKALHYWDSGMEYAEGLREDTDRRQSIAKRHHL